MGGARKLKIFPGPGRRIRHPGPSQPHCRRHPACAKNQSFVIRGVQFATTIHPYPDFFGTAYPDFPSDPNKCWMKSIFGPCGKRLGLSARRAETAQKARFPRYSETGRTAPPPRIRPVNTERVEIVFQGWRAKYPHPRHEASRRREMRFHRVIILTMPRLRVRQGKPGRNEISPRNNLA